MAPTPPIPEEIAEIPLARVHRGAYQPRDYFDAEAMEATRRSIAEKGQMVPAIVRPIRLGNPLFDPAWDAPHYELADGERRLRCCAELKLPALRAIVREISDVEMLDYAMTTNDSLPLNPVERAKVFQRLATEFGRTQEQIARSFNLKQQQVSELMRLLELPEDLRDLAARSVLSLRHARELLKLSDREKALAVGREVLEKGLSTRELSKKVKEIKKGASRIDNNDIKSIISDQNNKEYSTIDAAGTSYSEPLAGTKQPGWPGTLRKGLLSVFLGLSLGLVLHFLKPVLAAAALAGVAAIIIFEKAKIFKK